MAVGSNNVRTQASKNKNGYEHEERVLAKVQQVGRVFIGP